MLRKDILDCQAVLIMGVAHPPRVDALGLCYGGREGAVTDLECVMSSWWLASEAGAGEAAVEDVVAVLELA